SKIPFPRRPDMRACTLLALGAVLGAASSSLTVGPEGDLRPANDGKSAVDLYGDPLPPGAVARLGTVRLRRSGFAVLGRAGVGFLADGKSIITGDNVAVQFWETSGRLLREWRPEHGEVQSFAVSADGKRYAVATLDPPGLGSGKIRVYD